MVVFAAAFAGAYALPLDVEAVEVILAVGAEIEVVPK